MSDDESSSSEDIPLSALGKKAKYDDCDEAEFEDDEENEMGNEPNDDSDDFIVEDDDDDDDDGDYNSDSSDDVPLSSLKSPKKKATPTTEVKPSKKSASAKKDAPKKKATKTKTTKSKSSTPKKKTSSTKKASKAAPSSSASTNYLCASSELYSRCDKGKLIQSLLVRWWYAYQWPDPKTIPASTPKGGYDALDGFPGVYICTQGSNVGKFLDKRDRDQAPSFKNFAKKDSEELKDMLLRAIERQIKDLIKHEGEGTDAEKNLRALEKWTMKLNCSKADKEAEKVLKAKRLTLS
ncbi:hypothetical protein ACHAXA_004902 [Cyclostephanos tholiformis]|uniref:Uncharacterized protein n=1 Tax=Cyclostephanos tholiformis TaxID=382380 RepID=A0ABD3RWZ6_9STRA